MRKFTGRIALLSFILTVGAGLAGSPAKAEDALLLEGRRTAAAQLEQPVAAEPGAAPAAYVSNPRGRRRAAAAGPAGGAPGAYFIEFRSRYAQSYGHSYAAFGRLNSRGQIMSSEVAGLHPAGESAVPWMIGHLVPVPSETGPSDGDLEDQYISNRYRVTMGEADYNRLVAKIRQMQRSTPLWSATVYNCNSFLGDIAGHMGLKGGGSLLQVPPDYINSMRRNNGGRSSIAPGSVS